MTRLGRCLGLLAVSLVAACAGTPPPQQAAHSSSLPAMTKPVEPPAKTAEQNPPTARQKQLKPRPPAPQPRVDPARLVGLDPAALVRLLGNPWLKRDERPAQVWLYASGACAFHVFLYADPESGRHVVRYFDAVPRGTIPVSRDDCFNALLRRHGPAAAAGV